MNRMEIQVHDQRFQLRFLFDARVIKNDHIPSQEENR
jgi:hypothetical protein